MHANKYAWNKLFSALAPGCSTRYAVPFSSLTKSVPLPDKRPFPKELQHIGDHIKKARLKRQIPIKDVIALFEINRDTLRAWESGLWEPFVRHYPKIIQFLGYDPFTHETETLGGKIKKYRFAHGLSQDQFGALLNTDRTTVSFWETNRRLPLEKTVVAIKKIIGYV